MPCSKSFGARFAIGGEFEAKRTRIAAAVKLTRLTSGLDGGWSANGRTALARILQELAGGGVHHIHLPAYICESVLLPVRMLGLDYSFYPVDTDLVAHPDPPANAAVLLVHYFGRLNPAAPALRRQSGKNIYLIEDACQALLSDWRSDQSDNIYYLNSPRKFAEAPLGGWCNVRTQNENPNEMEDLAWQSFAARQTKAAYLRDSDEPIDELVENFYLRAFEDLENKFTAISATAGLPAWTAQIIAGIDWDSVARKRLENHQRLMTDLSIPLESPTSHFDAGEVPLGHLILLEDRDRLRERLFRERVFCPIHWPLPVEVSQRYFPDAHKLSGQCLTLPIDQRYGPEHMAKLAKILMAKL